MIANSIAHYDINLNTGSARQRQLRKSDSENNNTPSIESIKKMEGGVQTPNGTLYPDGTLLKDDGSIHSCGASAYNDYVSANKTNENDNRKENKRDDIGNIASNYYIGIGMVAKPALDGVLKSDKLKDMINIAYQAYAEFYGVRGIGITGGFTDRWLPISGTGYLVWDARGNIGLIGTHGTKPGTTSATIAACFMDSNADNISQLEGWSFGMGGSSGAFPAMGGELNGFITNEGKLKVTGEFIFGASYSEAAHELHGNVEYTKIIWQDNIFDILGLRE